MFRFNLTLALLFIAAYPYQMQVAPHYAPAMQELLTRLDRCDPDAAQLFRANVFYVGESHTGDAYQQFAGAIFLVDEADYARFFWTAMHEARHAWQSHQANYVWDFLTYPTSSNAFNRVEFDAIVYANEVRYRCLYKVMND